MTMSTRPRIESAIAGAPPSFPTVMAHTPSTLSAFGELYSAFWQTGSVSAVTKELTRLRNARVTDCGF
jgi:hypothetical protein